MVVVLVLPEGSSQVLEVVVVLLFLPESEVLFEEFDDALGIAEVVFLQFVNLVKSVAECLVGKIHGFLGVLHDLVIEDRKVEREAEFDRVACWEGDLHGLLVELEGILFCRIELRALSILCLVSVVVTDHFHEEAFGLSVARLGEHVVADDPNDQVAVFSKLLLDRGLVAAEGI